MKNILLGIASIIVGYLAWLYWLDNRTVRINRDYDILDDNGNVIETLLENSVIKISTRDKNGKSGFFKNGATTYTIINGIEYKIPNYLWEVKAGELAGEYKNPFYQY